MNEYLGTTGNDRIEQLALGLQDWVSILGLTGDDTIVFSLANVEGGPGNDVLIGLSEYSSVIYDHSPSAVEADLGAGWVKDGWGTTDSLQSIRVIAGSPFPDKLLGSRFQDTFWADMGDFVDGRDGNDVLVIWRPSAECSWSVAKNGELTVQHHSSGQVIRAVNIEELRFQDQNFLLLPGSSLSRTVFLDKSRSSSQYVTTMVRPININNDDLVDLIVANGTFPPNSPIAFAPRLLLQLADGSFKEATVSGPRTELIHPRDFASGDFNGDGFNDVVVVGHGYDTSPFPGERSALLLSDGIGGWIDRSDWLPVTPAFTHSVSVADVNHDGIHDIFLGNIWGQRTEPPRLLFGGPNGFQSSELPQLAGNLALQANGALPVGSLLCDLNGDSYIDLVAGGGTAGTMVFRGKSGSDDGRWFQEAATVLPTGRFGPNGQTITVNVIAEDVTNDGRIDLLLSQTGGEPFYGGRAIQLLAQDSNGTFVDVTAQRFPNFDFKGQWIVFLMTLDLNSDGFIDVLGSTQESGVSQGAMAWLNDGNGVFWEVDGRNKFPSVGFGMPALIDPSSLLAVTASEAGAITVTRFDFPDGMANKVMGTKEIDNFSFSEPRSTFQVDSIESNWRVWQKQSNGTMPVILDDVERLQFADAYLALDIEGNAGKAYRVYKAAFNRDPMLGDGKGLGYWISQIDKGMDLVELSARFVDSEEFRSLYGANPTNAQFLNKLYQNVLGRDPEASGYNWWLNELNTNPSKTKAKVLADFAESSENQAGVASLIGNGITYEPWVG